MNRLQRSSINMFASTVGYVTPMVINLIATPLLLHKLGEAAYGLQSLVAVVIGYLTIMDMGLAWPITKYLAEDHARNNTNAENRMLSTTIQLYGAIGLVGMVIIILSADLLAESVFKVPKDLVPSAIKIFRLAGIGFLGSVVLSWGQAVSMGLQRFEITYGVSAFTSLAGVGLGLGMVYSGYGVTGYVLMRVLVSLLSGVAFLLLVRRLLPTFRVLWGLDRVMLHRVKGYVGFGAVNRVLGNVIVQLDKTLIAVWIGIAAAGIYAVPLMVVNSLGYMLSYMVGFIFPMASELHSLGQLDHLRDIFTRCTRSITALGTMVFIPLLVLGDLFLNMWVGPSVAGRTTGVFRLLALSGYVGTLTVSLTNNVVIGIGKMRQFTVYSTIHCLALAAGCFLLIRPFGLEGAGIAWLCGNVVDIIFLLFALNYYLHISPLRLFRSAYFPPIVLGVVLGALSVLVRPVAGSWLRLILAGGVFELLYVLLGYWLGVFGETEKRAVIGMWQTVTQWIRPAEGKM